MHLHLVTIVAYVALGTALVIVLWPTEQAGHRFLRRWGIARPARQQSQVAAGYLRSRRLWYLVLFVVMPPVVIAGYRLLGQAAPPDSAFRLFLTLVGALLAAESIMALRQVRGVRVAVLAPRDWRALVPTWAIALLLALAGLALALAGVALAAQPWADRHAAALPPSGVPQPPDNYTVYVSDEFRAEITHSPGWLVLAGTLLCLAGVLGVVRLAVRRHAVPDPELDAVLRIRTARVAMGIGMGWLAIMSTWAVNRIGFLTNLSSGRPREEPAAPGWLAPVHSFTEFLGLVLLLVAAAGWIWVANPVHRTREPRPTG